MKRESSVASIASGQLQPPPKKPRGLVVKFGGGNL